VKVLHLPTSVGGHATGLSKAENSLGIDSQVLTRFRNYIDYNADIKLNYRKDTLWQKGLSFFKLLNVFLRIRNKYDIYHFNFGTTLLDIQQFGLVLPDLPYYTKTGKIFVTYNGCDARQKYPTMKRTEIAPCFDKSCYNGLCNSGKQDRIRQKSIKKFSKYASHIFALNPDLMWFLPEDITSFLPYTISNFYEIERTQSEFDKKNIRLVHAPTNRAAKGSSIIINAVEQLQKKYDFLELILVENLSNKEALKVYQTADILVDQVLAGWYGGVAVEAMKMGKPVLVYIRDADLKFIPPTMKEDLEKAVINVNPLNITDMLERCIQDRQFLKTKSENGYDYVNKWHDPGEIAKTVKQIYENA
jgi:hypothetical protein